MPEFIHHPVLLQEVGEALRPRSGGLYVDGTLGGGGHAEAILRASSPAGRLVGFDRDLDAVQTAVARLQLFTGRFELHHANFSEIAQWVSTASCDGMLLDLGVSSWQFDQAERGFSFQADGPLDMRMDRTQLLTAAQLVNETTEEDLKRIFAELGEEPQAGRVARAIVAERRAKPFESTGQLARLLERLVPRHGRKRHPATRVFMALRMKVNGELEALQSAMAAACTVLKPGGRLAVITFHSVEDRVVKQFGQVQTRAYSLSGPADIPEWRVPCSPRMRWLYRKPLVPAASEVAQNPRARSAKLRVLEQL